jgi:hypothetical protein
MLLATLLMAPAASCGKADDASSTIDERRVDAGAALQAPQTAEDSARTSAAIDALVAWLDASVERSDSVPAYDVAGCDEASAFPSPLLARYEVMEARLRGDTVVARASVTTVAEQDVDRRSFERFVARQRVRTDVLEWDVIPTGDGWQVCNGIRFGYRGADSLTSWLPEGTSIATARALADSVRASDGQGRAARQGGS